LATLKLKLQLSNCQFNVPNNTNSFLKQGNSSITFERFMPIIAPIIPGKVPRTPFITTVVHPSGQANQEISLAGFTLSMIKTATALQNLKCFHKSMFV
jgi:hypothetical protein